MPESKPNLCQQRIRTANFYKQRWGFLDMELVPVNGKYLIICNNRPKHGKHGENRLVTVCSFSVFFFLSFVTLSFSLLLLPQYCWFSLLQIRVEKLMLLFLFGLFILFTHAQFSDMSCCQVRNFENSYGRETNLTLAPYEDSCVLFKSSN